MHKKINQLTQTNELILFEFYNRMKGVLNNRYSKSKGFQFAMLNKNLNELSNLLCLNNRLIKAEFHRKCRCKTCTLSIQNPLDT